MGKSMSPAPPASSPWSLTATAESNLERLLYSLTPRVSSKLLPKNRFPNLNISWQPPTKDKNIVEYFTLGDLWECFQEWSAYGIGTPLVLNDGECITQYFVPYLSAIQIFTNKTVTIEPARNSEEDSDAAEFETDSWSDDSGSDKLSGSTSNNSSRAWDAVSEGSSVEQESSCPTKDKLGCLYLQYFEMCSPYWRPPLMDKMTELSRTHPGLITLKNVDLSPASWMAVAWYPIYHIPSGKQEKDLSTCFLTYHTLSSTFQDSALGYEYDNIRNGNCSCKPKGVGGEISLPPFGLATYKMHGDVWLQLDSFDHERIIYLYSAADSWLKQLNVSHHDFSFFTTNCFL